MDIRDRDRQRSARGPGTVLARFSVPSDPGKAREVTERVRAICAGLGLSRERSDALDTAVAEATMNAIEHGNRNDPSLRVEVSVSVSEDALVVRIADEGVGRGTRTDPEPPDIEAKLRGEQSPRGWGLFLIRKMVDDLRAFTDDEHHVVELVVRLDAPLPHLRPGTRPSG